MAWTHVQTSAEATLGTGGGNGGTSKTLTLNGVTAGNVLVCYIASWRATNLDSGVLTVSGGGTWTNLVSDASSASKNRAQISFTASATGGNTTITVTSVNACDLSFFMSEFSGGNTPTAGQTHGGSAGAAATSVSSGATAGAANAGDLVMGVYSDDGENPGTIAATGNPNVLDARFPSSTVPSVAGFYLLSATAAAQTASFTMSSANQPNAVVGCLVPGSGGGGAPAFLNQRTVRGAG